MQEFCDDPLQTVFGFYDNEYKNREICFCPTIDSGAPTGEGADFVTRLNKNVGESLNYALCDVTPFNKRTGWLQFSEG